MNTIKYSRTALLALAVALASGAALAQGHGEGRHAGRMDFDQIDTDQDGRVTQAEVEAFQSARRQSLDADGDGFVSFEEMSAQRRARNEERAKTRFLALDTNGDGKVSLAEMPAPRGRMFERLDRNHDGVIERDEIARCDGRRRARRG